MIPTARRLQYALGYLNLGLVREAAGEMDAVPPEDRDATEVLAVRMEVHMAAQEWPRVADLARDLIARDRDLVGAWVALGCAVRRVESVAAARDLLLLAEPLHGDRHAVIHYNLACYHCLLGELDAAKTRLGVAVRMDENFKETARTDPDLQGMAEAVRKICGA